MDKIVLFDVMGTLVYDPYRVELPAFFGLTFAELVAQKDRSVWPAFERGEISEGEFLSHYFGDGRDIDADALHLHLQSSYRLLEGIEPLLNDLSNRGVEMHAFSNYPSWYTLIENALTLTQFLEWTFVSCEIGIRKPDRAIYEYAVETIGTDAKRLVFVDDREENVDAARAVGMNGIVFESADQLRRALDELGVTISA